MKIDERNISNTYSKYKVSDYRAKHSLGVAEIARELATLYKVDCDKAWLAGALHDITRDWTPEKLLDFARQNKLRLTSDDIEAPILIHSKAAAYLSEHELSITDKEILAAIENHTLGRPKMKPLEQIIYIADFLESTVYIPEHEKVRKALLSSLEAAIALINESQIVYYKSKGLKINNQFNENRLYYSKFLPK